MSFINIPLISINNEILINSTSSENTTPPVLVKAKNPNGTLLTDTSSSQWYFSDGEKYQAQFIQGGMGMCWTLDGNYVGDNNAGSEALILTGFPGSWDEVKDQITAYRLYIPEHYEDQDTHEWVGGHWGEWRELGSVSENTIVLPNNMKYEYGVLYIRDWVTDDEVEEPIEPRICMVKNSTGIPLILNDPYGDEVVLEWNESKELESGNYTIVDTHYSGIEIGDGKVYEMTNVIPITGSSIEITQHMYEIPEGFFEQIERDYPLPEPVEVPPQEIEVPEEPEYDRYYDPDFPYGDKSAFRVFSDETYHTFTFKVLDIETENTTATIDWGDGETTTISTGNNLNVSHRYSKIGYYIITIDNTIDAIGIIGNSQMTQGMLCEVYQLGDSITALFDFCFNDSNITHIELPHKLNKIGIHSFDGCKYLKTISFKGSEAPELHGEIFNTTMGSAVTWKNEMKLIIPWDSTGYEAEGSPWIDILVNQCGYKLEHAYFKKYVDVKKLEEEMIMNTDIFDVDVDDDDNNIPMYQTPCAEDNTFPEYPEYE